MVNNNYIKYIQIIIIISQFAIFLIKIFALMRSYTKCSNMKGREKERCH